MGLFNLFKKQMTVAEGFAIIMDDNASARWKEAGAAFPQMKEDGRLQNIGAVAAKLRGVYSSFSGEDTDTHTKIINMLWSTKGRGEVSIIARQMIGAICKRWPEFAKETKELALKMVNGENPKEALFYLAADAFHGCTDTFAPDKAKEYLDALFETGEKLISEPLVDEVKAKLKL